MTTRGAQAITQYRRKVFSVLHESLSTVRSGLIASEPA